MIATYFDHVGEAYPVLTRLPVAGVSLDFVYGPHNRELVAQHGWPEDKTLFAGVVNGRNVWINDLAASLDLIDELRERTGDNLVVSTSCSLQHSPVDKTNEPRLDAEVLSWMSFAVQKLDEVAALTRATNEGRDAISAELDANAKALEDRRNSPRTRNPQVRERLAKVTDSDARRESPFSTRRDAQHERLGLPLFPTTTIGSFPQTSEIRTARARLRKGEIDDAKYLDLMRERGRARDPPPGGHRAGRARARRARAQRHGPVLRGADGRLRVHRQRVGAELRLALRAPADHLRRRVAPERDDRRLDQVRAVAHGQAGEGHAHRSGDDAHVVVRAR